MECSPNSILLVEPASIQHIETLLAGRENFSKEFGIPIVDDYELMPKILELSLKELIEKTVFPCWWIHLFILYEPRVLVGIGGYKGNPDLNGMVELGYSIADSYQNRGLGTRAAKILLDRAFKHQEIKRVTAHTLAEENYSTRILKKLGLKLIAQLEDPEDGIIWRWEIKK